jgi:hypothetical protein
MMWKPGTEVVITNYRYKAVYEVVDMDIGDYAETMTPVQYVRGEKLCEDELKCYASWDSPDDEVIMASHDQWSLHQRVYPHEKEALCQLPEEVLTSLLADNKVIPDRAFGFASLVGEIRFSRYWLEKMKKDREASDEALGRSLKREMVGNAFIREVLGDLQMAREVQRPIDVDMLIKKIDDVVNGGVQE